MCRWMVAVPGAGLTLTPSSLPMTPVPLPLSFGPMPGPAILPELGGERQLGDGRDP